MKCLFWLPRNVERAFVIAGVLLLAIAVWQLGVYSAFQSYPQWFSYVQSGAGDRIAGRLKVQRLGLSVLVLNGDDQSSLKLGAGLLEGTPPIGADGNTVIAGHRDFAFRALRDIKIGDLVHIEAAKSYAYRVESTRIVDPDDLSVLESDGKPELTLITCYPFYYTGEAPKRFIVQARPVGEPQPNLVDHRVDTHAVSYFSVARLHDAIRDLIAGFKT
jgi:LPXTG-site transpeptidase (sortase) family protein